MSTKHTHTHTHETTHVSHRKQMRARQRIAKQMLMPIICPHGCICFEFGIVGDRALAMRGAIGRGSRTLDVRALMGGPQTLNEGLKHTYRLSQTKAPFATNQGTRNQHAARNTPRNTAWPVLVTIGGRRTRDPPSKSPSKRPRTCIHEKRHTQ